MPLPLRLPYLPRVLVATMTTTLVLLLSITHVSAQGSGPVETGPLPIPNGAIPTPGASITIQGTGFLPNATVTIIVASDPVEVGTATTDATGAFQTTVTIPANLPAGEHHLRASGPAASGGTLVLETAFQVQTGAPGSGGSLPVTGGSPWLLLIPAGIAAGVGLVLTQRHRLTQLVGGAQPAE